MTSHDVDQDADGTSDCLPLHQPEAYQWPGYVDFQKDVAFLYNSDE